MAFLSLRNLRTDEEHVFRKPEILGGRDAELDLVPTEPGSEVVSARHFACHRSDGMWFVEDLGSSNGTYLNDARLEIGQRHPLRRGDVLRLGVEGFRYTVEAVMERNVAATVVEAMPLPGQPPSPQGPADDAEALPLPPNAFSIRVRELQTEQRFTGVGGRVRLGRGRECEIRPAKGGDIVMSRVHAEIVLAQSGRALLRDLHSKNGTFVNGIRLAGEHDLVEGDAIELGSGGPKLLVERLKLPDFDAVGPAPRERSAEESVSGAFKALAEGPTELLPEFSEPTSSPPAAPAPAPSPVAPPDCTPRTSYDGKGRTQFFRQLFEETTAQHAARLRWVIISAVALSLVTVGIFYLRSESRVRSTNTALERAAAALAAQKRLADSIQAEAQADRDRLRQELADASALSAPVGVVDSLRGALSRATRRTSSLQEALERAESSINGQLAAAETRRVVAAERVALLQTELRNARTNGSSSSVVDSLQAELDVAREQTELLDGQMEAVRGVNLATIAQANQGAVGLVSSYLRGALYSGSGFVISPSGYFVTNRHVVMPNGFHADSVFVTMADQRERVTPKVVRISEQPGPDLAVLQIEAYRGPHVHHVDWSGRGATQGEPAAIIGFPAGLATALDPTATVRTTMSAGIFSKVQQDVIQFDGFTVGGSSGSPIFNRFGLVVGVHRAGLREAVGMAFAEPMSLVLRLLPARVRSELGL